MVARKKQVDSGSSDGNQEDWASDRGPRRGGDGTSGHVDKAAEKARRTAEQAELKKEKNIRTALLRIGEESQSNEEIVVGALDEVRKKAEGLNIDPQQIEFVFESFRETVLVDPEAVIGFVSFVEAVREASDGQIIGGFRVNAVALLKPNFDSKISKLMGVQFKGSEKTQKAKERKEQAQGLKDEFQEDPIGAIHALEKVMADFGVPADQIKILRDPTELTPEEILEKKREEFDIAVEKLQEAASIIKDGESDGMRGFDELGAHVRELRKLFETNPDGATDEIKSLLDALEISQQQFQNLVEKYNKLRDSDFLEKEEKNHQAERWSEHGEALVEKFKGHPVEAYISLKKTVDELENIVVDEKLRRKSFVFNNSISKLKSAVDFNKGVMNITDERYRQMGEEIGAVRNLFDSDPDVAIAKVEVIYNNFEELRQKYEKFNKLAAKIQARAEAHQRIEADAHEALEQIKQTVQDARSLLETDPDEAIERLQDTHDTIETGAPTFAQMNRLADRFLAASVSFGVSEENREIANIYVKELLDGFKDDPFESFVTLTEAVTEAEKEKAAADAFVDKLEKLQRLYLGINGADSMDELSRAAKEEWENISERRKNEFVLRKDEALDSLDEVLELKEAELVRVTEERENEAEFDIALTQYLDEASRYRSNIGMRKTDITASRRGAYSDYSNEYKRNPDGARAKMNEKMEEARKINAYADLLAAPGRKVRGAAKYNFVSQYRDLLISEDTEENEMADERLQIELIFAEYLLRAAAAGVEKRDVRDLKDTVNEAIEAGEHLDDLIEFLQGKVEELPPVVEEDTSDEDTEVTSRAVIEGDADEDENTETIGVADHSGTSAETVAAVAAGAVAAGAVAHEILSNDDEEEPENIVEPNPIVATAEVVAEAPKSKKKKTNILLRPFEAVGNFFGTPIEKVAKNKSVQTSALIGGAAGGGLVYGAWKLVKGFWGFGRKLIGLDEVKILGDDKKEKNKAS